MDAPQFTRDGDALILRQGDRECRISIKGWRIVHALVTVGSKREVKKIVGSVEGSTIEVEYPKIGLIAPDGGYLCFEMHREDLFHEITEAQEAYIKECRRIGAASGSGDLPFRLTRKGEGFEIEVYGIGKWESSTKVFMELALLASMDCPINHSCHNGFYSVYHAKGDGRVIEFSLLSPYGEGDDVQLTLREMERLSFSMLVQRQ